MDNLIVENWHALVQFQVGSQWLGVVELEVGDVFSSRCVAEEVDLVAHNQAIEV